VAVSAWIIAVFETGISQNLNPALCRKIQEKRKEHASPTYAAHALHTQLCWWPEPLQGAWPGGARTKKGGWG
jgi:hypothetical protein